MAHRISLSFPWKIVLLSIALAGCSFTIPQSPTSAFSPPRRAPSQTGIASWYGPGFHGLPTASGSIYNQYELTAAHPTLPLGTRVMVTNLENGRSTEVVVNDRGPFVKGRIIDLSYAAAHVLGMIGPGTIPVRIEVINGGPHRIQKIRKNLVFTIQAGSFVEFQNAEELKQNLQKNYPDMVPISIVSLNAVDGTYYRVRIGTFTNREEAETRARHLDLLGFLAIIMEK